MPESLRDVSYRKQALRSDPTALGTSRSPTHHKERVMNLRASKLWISAILLLAGLAGISACYSSKGTSYPTSPGISRELDSGDFGPGATFQHQFAAAGTFGYHCIHHGPMVGSVQVSDAATETVVNVSITSSTSAFPAATVKTGGRVVWTNNTNMVHTVTSN
jgi:plastocyanin